MRIFLVGWGELVTARPADSRNAAASWDGL